MWYELDVNDRLVAVSEDWDGLSAAAGAPGAAFAKIRFQPIWNYVTGAETQRFLRAMFFLAKNKRRSISLPYRVEQQGLRQSCRMRIEPVHSGGLLISHENLPCAQPAPPQLLPYTTTNMMRCSQYLRINVDGVWYQAEPELEQHGHADWRVCPDCKGHALGLINEAAPPAVAHPAHARFGKS